MDDLRTRFGRLVAAHRRRLGWTQEVLAERAGVSVDMIAKIEVGATGARFPTIDRLAAALSVDPAELFTTEVPQGRLRSERFTVLTAQLAGLSDRDLAWVQGLLNAALRPRG